MEKPKKTKRGRKNKKKTSSSEVEQQSARALLELKGVDDEPSSPQMSLSELDNYLEFDTPPEFASAQPLSLQHQGTSEHQLLSQSAADQFISSPLQGIGHHHPHHLHQLQHQSHHFAQIQPTDDVMDNEHHPRKKRKKQAMYDTVVDPALMRGIDVVHPYVNGTQMAGMEQQPVDDFVNELIQHPPTDDEDQPMIEAAESLPELPELPELALASDPDPDPDPAAAAIAIQEPSNKRQPTKKRPRAPRQVPGQPAPSGGTFTEEELQAIDDYFVKYRQRQHPPLTHEELCKRVWANNRAKDSFWDSVCQVLPNRPKASIYKHIRRTYHIYQVRGKWTSEDDESLKNLVEEKGRVWKIIGAELERMPEDCRDRWRNYVKCGDKRGQNAWTPAEEQKLLDAVDSCLDELIKHKLSLGQLSAPSPNETTEDRDARLEKEKEALHDDINWTVVSDRMDGWRSRIQCRYKWNKMKNTPEEPPDANNNNNELITKQPPAPSKVFRKQDLQIGDQIWLMSEIIKQGYMVYNKIDWDALSKLDPMNSWLPSDLKTTFTRLRSMVRLHTRMNVQEIAKKILTDLEELPGDMRNKRTDGKLIQAQAIKERAMKVQAAREKAMQAEAANGEDVPDGTSDGQTPRKKKRKRGHAIRSEEYVDEADLEDEKEEEEAAAVAAIESTPKKRKKKKEKEKKEKEKEKKEKEKKEKEKKEKEKEKKEKKKEKKRSSRNKKYMDDPGLGEEDVADGLHAQAMAGGVVMDMPNFVDQHQANNLSTALGETAKAVMQYFDHGRLVDEDYDAVDDDDAVA